MTREEIMQLNTDYLNNCESEQEMNELFYYALELQKHEQEPCEDAISIDNVIEWLKNKDIIKLSTQEEVARKELRELSSVNVKEKTGRWIFVDKAKEHAHCSECDYGNVDLFDGRPHNYCPNCGARNEVEE